MTDEEKTVEDYIANIDQSDFEKRIASAFPEIYNANFSLASFLSISSAIINTATDTVTDLIFPDQIRFFEIDINGDANRINFEVSNSGYSTEEINSWSDVECELKKAVKTNKKFPNQKAPKWVDKPRSKKPPLTGMSLLVPDVFANSGSQIPKSGRCLFVFRLANKKKLEPGGKKHQYRFSRLFSPITIGDNSIKCGAKTVDPTKFFSMSSQIADPNSSTAPSRRVLTEWLNKTEPRELTIGQYDETEWACILFDFEALRGEIDQEPLPEFAIRFNLHIEVRDKKKGENFIPIIVDPDIGHPGGNAPDP